MAKVIPTDFGGAFMVEMGVGPGRANNRGDVTLVQYLMNLWIETPRAAVYRQKLGSAHNKKLDVDGIYGPKTGARIKQFQKFIANGKSQVICDGRIDKMPGEWVSSDNRIRYTISELNIEVFVEHCLDFVDSVKIVASRSDFPPSLKPMVSRYLFSLEL